MKPTPTAIEIIRKTTGAILTSQEIDAWEPMLTKAMIEFAKLHVTEALKAASESAVVFMPTHSHLHNTKNVSKDSILNAYPLSKIV